MAYTNGGGWVNTSDARKKKNIRDLKTNKSLQKVLSCKPKTYNLINNDPLAPPDTPLIGLIAQDQLATNPHCVSMFKDKDDEKTEYYGVAYHDYTVHLIGAVQEQQKQIASQQITINAMADHIKTLTDTLNAVLAKYPI